MGDAAFSCFVSTIGLVLPFVLLDPPTTDGEPGVPISNAESASVTWVNQQGIRRPLTYSNQEAALFTYVLSSGDTRSPHQEQGYLQVSLGAAVYMTSAFLFRVIDHF